MVAAFGHVHAGRRGHVLVYDGVDAPREFGHADAGLGGYLADGGFRFGDIDRHRAAGKRLRVEVAEHEVGIGHRGLLAAASVAGRAGQGARALRADLEQAQFVQPRNAAATCADLDQLDGGDRNGQAAAFGQALFASRLEAVADQRPAVLDDGELCGRAAHVEREHVAHPGTFAEERACERAGGRAGFEQLDRYALGFVHVREAAVGEHHEERGADAERRNLAAHEFEVAVGKGRDVGVRHRGRAAFVFADLRRDFRGDRYEQVRVRLADQVARALLVLRIGVRVQEHDRHRIHAVGQQLRGGCEHRLVVERRLDRAVRPGALGHLVPQVPWNERLGQFDVQVVKLVLVLARHLEGVAEPGRGDEAGRRTIAFDQRVGKERGRVDHPGDVGVGDLFAREELLHAADDALVRGVSGGEFLVRERKAGGVRIGDDVGERAADVDTKRVCVCSHFIYRLRNR